MKFIVGSFVLLTFVSLFVFLGIFLGNKGSFDDRFTYHFKTDSAESFKDGMPIKYSGFPIGRIQKIALQDDGSVHISFSVHEKNRKWLSQGSILMIIQPLLGSSYIELYTSADSELLKDNAFIALHSSDTINDLIQKLQPAVEKANNILNNIDIITSYLADENSELKQILVNLNTFSKKLAQNDALLTTVTGDEAATKSLIKSLNETTQIMKDVKKITKDISAITASLDTDIVKPASSSIKEIHAIMKDIKSKLEAIDGTVQAVGDSDADFIELKKQITAGIQKSNEIMDKVDSLMQNSTQTEVILP